MKCCPNCFGDKGLKKEIFPLLSKESGKCNFCDSDNQPLINPKDLIDYFELLLGVYKIDSSGRPLIKCLMYDWSLFPSDMINEAKAQILLGEVLDNGDIVRKSYSALHEDIESLNAWEDLKSELMCRNRFFPNNTIDFDRLESQFSRLIWDIEEIPSVWYRSRIKEDGKDFTTNDMGPPPPKKTSHGRANPIGIPYLYIGSSIASVISEVRPHPGESVCTVECRLHNNLKIVDLRKPRATISPFLLSDENEIASLRNDLKLLEKLGDELSTPVLPTSVAIDYIPSQYLCEFIKKCGYSGVAYKSSVSDGINLALFDADNAEIIDDSLHEHLIKRVTVEYN